ncbi:hypothetical protein LTR85_005080 [Meristemomyces frigidus]|nr:hypothetical protein LTR85_005080 [Meristemomyces frigidus]
MGSGKTTFLDLPPEIRNHIYELSGCLKGLPMLQMRSTVTRRGSRHAQEHTLPTTQPSLTMMSKQVRRDTLPMFYGNHGFVFTRFDTESDGSNIETWLEALGAANAKMLFCVVIVVRKKKQQLYVEKTLLPKMRQLGVRVDDIFLRSVRVGYPFCCCETCVMRTAGLLV